MCFSCAVMNRADFGLRRDDENLDRSKLRQSSSATLSRWPGWAVLLPVPVLMLYASAEPTSPKQCSRILLRSDRNSSCHILLASPFITCYARNSRVVHVTTHMSSSDRENFGIPQVVSAPLHIRGSAYSQAFPVYFCFRHHADRVC